MILESRPELESWLNYKRHFYKWTSNDYKDTRIKDIHTSHLYNIFRMLYNHSCDLVDCPVIEASKCCYNKFTNLTYQDEMFAMILELDRRELHSEMLSSFYRMTYNFIHYYPIDTSLVTIKPDTWLATGGN